MPNTTTTSSLQYTPPGGQPITIPFSVTTAYTPQCVGTLKIAAGTIANFAFDVPLGTMSIGTGNCKALEIHNRLNGQDIGLRINGIPVSPAVVCQLPPGGRFKVEHPTSPSSGPLQSVQVDTMAAQAANAEIDFWAFGD